jgi:hypothetical protein
MGAQASPQQQIAMLKILYGACSAALDRRSQDFSLLGQRAGMSPDSLSHTC